MRTAIRCAQWLSLALVCGLLAFLAYTRFQPPPSSMARGDDVAREGSKMRPPAGPVSVENRFSAGVRLARQLAQQGDRVPVPASLSPFQQAMLSETASAMATRLAWERRIADRFGAARTACFPAPPEASSVLEIGFLVTSSQDQLRLSNFEVRVSQGAPVGDPVLRCLEAKLQEDAPLRPPQGLSFLADFSDRMSGFLSVN